MTMYIGLLRAVNVTGHNKIRMADLRDFLSGLGMEDVRTLLQSGNVVFHSGERSAARLERVLGEEAKQRLGLETEFFLRTAREWKAVVGGNPFAAEAKRDPSRLAVMFLRKVPPPGAVAALRRAIKGREVVRAKGKHAYIVYPDGLGRSRLTTAVIERALGSRVTGRNWNTVLKLGVLANPS